MKIALLSPSIYMSPTKYGDMIFAPRDLSIALADGLVDRGHDVYFFTSSDVKTKAKLIPGDQKLISVDYVTGSLQGQESDRLQWGYSSVLKHNYESDLTMRCYKMARENNFDVIHSYHERLAHFWNEFTSFPTVYTLHDPLPTHKDTLFYWLLERFFKQNYVSISNRYKEFDQIGLNFVDTVYHGIHANAYAYSSKEGSYLAFIGRLIAQKGVEDAIDAAKRVHLKLHIATSVLPQSKNDDNYYDEKLAGLITPELVHVITFLSNDSKSEFLSNAKALLFPVKWEEPFGMVMIEAMACGTPVIAYNRGSVSEIVRDGVTGFIVDPDNEDRPGKGTWVIKKQGVEGLVEAVKRIGEIDRKMCRKHVEENFTVEKMVEGYEAVYRKVLGTPL